MKQAGIMSDRCAARLVSGARAIGVPPLDLPL